MNKAVLLLALMFVSFIQSNVIHYHYHFQKEQGPKQQDRQLKEYMEGLRHAARRMTGKQTHTSDWSGIDDEEASYVGDADWMYD